MLHFLPLHLFIDTIIFIFQVLFFLNIGVLKLQMVIELVLVHKLRRRLHICTGNNFEKPVIFVTYFKKISEIIFVRKYRHCSG